MSLAALRRTTVILAALLGLAAAPARAQNQITIQIWGTTWQSVVQSLAAEFE